MTSSLLRSTLARIAGNDLEGVKGLQARLVPLAFLKSEMAFHLEGRDAVIRPYRYIVLVTNDRLRAPADVPFSGGVYRHVIVAVDPSTPSKVAGRIARGKSGRRKPPVTAGTGGTGQV